MLLTKLSDCSKSARKKNDYLNVLVLTMNKMVMKYMLINKHASMVKEVCALKDLPIIKVYTDSNSLKEHLETTKIITVPCCQENSHNKRN